MNRAGPRGELDVARGMGQQRPSWSLWARPDTVTPASACCRVSHVGSCFKTRINLGGPCLEDHILISVVMPVKCGNSHPADARLYAGFQPKLLHPVAQVAVGTRTAEMFLPGRAVIGGGPVDYDMACGVSALAAAAVFNIPSRQSSVSRQQLHRHRQQSPVSWIQTTWNHKR